jgi:hypothetical protein
MLMRELLGISSLCESRHAETVSDRNKHSDFIAFFLFLCTIVVGELAQ